MPARDLPVRRLVRQNQRRADALGHLPGPARHLDAATVKKAVATAESHRRRDGVGCRFAAFRDNEGNLLVWNSTLPSASSICVSPAGVGIQATGPSDLADRRNVSIES
jgi:hypothetical protein